MNDKVKKSLSMNWELFLDSYFHSFEPIISKTEYRKGTAITYSKNSIYVWCDINENKDKIKKLEFGRDVPSRKGKVESNWIKGIFTRQNTYNYTTFLQTSFDGEDGKEFEIDLNEVNKNAVLHFLKTPCETGWNEIEYYLDNDKFYKVVVTLDNQNWAITLLGFEEQDIPLGLDRIDQWSRVKIADAFWNNKRRRTNEIFVMPMKGK